MTLPVGTVVRFKDPSAHATSLGPATAVDIGVVIESPRWGHHNSSWSFVRWTRGEYNSQCQTEDCELIVVTDVVTDVTEKENDISTNDDYILKSRVFEVAMQYAEENDWCAEVQRALEDLGIKAPVDHVTDGWYAVRYYGSSYDDGDIARMINVSDNGRHLKFFDYEGDLREDITKDDLKKYLTFAAEKTQYEEHAFLIPWNFKGVDTSSEQE